MLGEISSGSRMPFTAGSAYSSGDVIAFAQVGIGVVIEDVASGDEGVLAMHGVFSLAAETGVTFSQGDRLYWDTGNDYLTKTVSTFPVVGYAFADKASAAAVAEVFLIPMADSDPGQLAQAANVAALAGTLTGTTDGTLADVADIALSTSDMYTDSAVNTAVNTAIADVNEQLKELQTTLNAEIAALKASGLQASS